MPVCSQTKALKHSLSWLNGFTLTGFEASKVQVVISFSFLDLQSPRLLAKIYQLPQLHGAGLPEWT